MIERLEAIIDKYNELDRLLLKQEVLNDYNLLKKYSKEKSDLEKTVTIYKKYKKVLSSIDEANKMLADPELNEIASEELIVLEKEKETLFNKLEILLVPQDENDGKNVIMEIRGAAGGDEANIFSGDLFRMYSYYAEKNGWKIEIINSIEGTSGGFSQIEYLIKGENVYSKLKYESGSHRVQRVPETESQGRVHTSTVTVLVMPEYEDVNVEIKESDLKIDVFHSSGAGGQSVNTSNSAVRITHVPTGIVVTCQTERSQLKNKEIAMSLLKNKINNDLMEKQQLSEAEERKSKIGTGDRSEKIRTYNYSQNRVTDHRINFSIMELDKVMDGYLDPIIEALINEDMRLKLAGIKK
ncbi:MAG: peptide chain release factor 1 [Mollicutes bacterium]|nr:peptide chain release factor 1 [Mollicutes bacterium]